MCTSEPFSGQYVSMPSTLDAHRLICPHDGELLTRVDTALRCSGGHSFDIAREGYVNLLPVAQKASRHPGDSAAMVQARRRVMDSGLFRPVADAVVKSISSGASLIVDCGCGDGGFTQQVAEAVPAAKVLALDVSKDAVRAAAKRRAGLACVVASGKSLPVPAGEAGVLLCLFGFPFWEHWSQWQAAGQCVVTVDPGPEHLLELREAIYPEVLRHDAPAHGEAAQHDYALRHTKRVQYSSEPVASWTDLLEMTPHGRRCTPEARERLVDTARQAVTIDVVVRTYERQ